MNSEKNNNWDTPENLNYKTFKTPPRFQDNFKETETDFQRPKMEEKQYFDPFTNIKNIEKNTQESRQNQSVENNFANNFNPDILPQNQDKKQIQEPKNVNLEHLKKLANNQNLENGAKNGDKIEKNMVKKPAGLSIFTVVSILIMALLAGAVSSIFTAAFLHKYLNQPKTNSIQNPTTELEKVKIVEEDSSVINVAKSSLDSVVSIVGSKSFDNNLRDLLQNKEVPELNKDTKPISRKVSAGSGFVVTSDGYIITNKHVIEDKNLQYSVVFNDGTEAIAEVLDVDKILDIGFLKINPSKLKNKLNPLNIGDSSRIQIGQTAIAIGNSLGEFRNTVSKGIISGLDRNIVASDQNGSNAESLENIIQTDASINSGNSGGPLFDINGNVIGVNVARAQNGDSIGFSIPINSVKGILDSVIRTGKISRAYLGVAFLNITPEISTNQKLPVSEGAFVWSRNGLPAVTTGSPADKAGLKDGDIIIKINGKNITQKYSLATAIAEIPAGKNIEITILRNNQEQILRTTLLEMPNNFR